LVKLYINERSGNSYKPRLLLSMLGVPYETVAIDLAKREQKRPEYLKVNPRGQVPALEDDGTVIWDSTAILTYLARKYGGDRWLPVEPEPMAKVMQWLAFAQNEIHYGLQFARAIRHFGRRGDPEECCAYGRTALTVLQGHLASDPWLALRRMTIADIACFPYVAMAPDADIALDEYPAIVAWIDRIKAQPGFIPLPAIKEGAA
jgi:glutathione S-transferase